MADRPLNLPRKHLTTLLFLYALHAPVLQCTLHYFLHLKGFDSMNLSKVV